MLKIFFEEKIQIMILILYIIVILLLLFFNPYWILYQPKEFEELYFTKENNRIKNCAKIIQIEEKDEYKKIKICKQDNCYIGHLNNKNEFAKGIENLLEKNVCFFGKIKKVYNNNYLEIESLG